MKVGFSLRIWETFLFSSSSGKFSFFSAQCCEISEIKINQFHTFERIKVKEMRKRWSKNKHHIDEKSIHFLIVEKVLKRKWAAKRLLLILTCRFKEPKICHKISFEFPLHPYFMLSPWASSLFILHIETRNWRKRKVKKGKTFDQTSSEKWEKNHHHPFFICLLSFFSKDEHRRWFWMTSSSSFLLNCKKK